MRTETPEDKENERLVIERIEAWMQEGWPEFDYKLRQLETPLDEKGYPQKSADYQVWRGHLHTGYGEVKCFTKPLSFYIKHGGFLIDDPKLEYLMNLGARGFSVMLAYRVVDHRIFYAQIPHLYDNQDKWEVAPEHYMNRRQHKEGGYRAKPYKGWLLPIELFKEIK